MSTESKILKLESEGKLIRFLPLNMTPDEGEVRRISVLPSLQKWLFNDDNSHYKSAVRAHLKEFIIGTKIDNTNFMKQLVPFDKGVWEFSPRFNPQHRIFGAFIERDWFIATHQQERKKCDKQWTKEINDTLKNWGRLFGTLKPLNGNSFSDFVYKGVDNDKRKKK